MASADADPLQAAGDCRSVAVVSVPVFTGWPPRKENSLLVVMFRERGPVNGIGSFTCGTGFRDMQAGLRRDAAKSPR